MPTVPRVRTIASVGVGTLALSVVAATAAVGDRRSCWPASVHAPRPTTARRDTRPLASRPATRHPAAQADAARRRRPAPPRRHRAQLDRLAHRSRRSPRDLGRPRRAADRRSAEAAGHRRTAGHIRGLTPSFTAHSTALWKSIARGELTVGFANSRHLHRYFGKTVLARGAHALRTPLRIGAFATIGLPGAQGMVASAAGARAWAAGGPRGAGGRAEDLA